MSEHRGALQCDECGKWCTPQWLPIHKCEKPRVVHCKREPYDVYIGRPSKWGNPFSIGRHGTRREVIIKYHLHLLQHPELVAQIDELRGKTLGCWCAPQPCHGDILLQLANATDRSE